MTRADRARLEGWGILLILSGIPALLFCWAHPVSTTADHGAAIDATAQYRYTEKREMVPGSKAYQTVVDEIVPGEEILARDRTRNLVITGFCVLVMLIGGVCVRIARTAKPDSFEELLLKAAATRDDKKAQS